MSIVQQNFKSNDGSQLTTAVYFQVPVFILGPSVRKRATNNDVEPSLINMYILTTIKTNVFILNLIMILADIGGLMVQ